MSQTITIDEIYASTSIEQSLKRVLLSLEEQDLRPVALSKWAKAVFSEARRLQHDDNETVGQVKAVANSRHYHDSQISRVLTDNGISREERFGSGGGGGSGGNIGNWYIKFKTIALDATGVDESDIIDANYSPTKITKLAEDSLREWTSRMNDADQKLNLRWLKIVQAILERGSELIEQRMKQPKIDI